MWLQHPRILHMIECKPRIHEIEEGTEEEILYREQEQQPQWRQYRRMYFLWGIHEHRRARKEFKMSNAVS